MSHEDDPKQKAGQIGAYITLPFVLAIPPLLGAVLGRWFDSWLGSDPYLMYTFLILGFCAGVREFWRILKRFRDDI